jgi:hypothetical protein
MHDQSARKSPDIGKNRFPGSAVTALMPEFAKAIPVTWRRLAGMQSDVSDKQRKNAQSPSCSSLEPISIDRTGAIEILVPQSSLAPIIGGQ